MTKTKDKKEKTISEQIEALNNSINKTREERNLKPFNKSNFLKSLTKDR